MMYYIQHYFDQCYNVTKHFCQINRSFELLNSTNVLKRNFS